MTSIEHYQRQLEYSLGTPFVEDNEVELLLNGDEIFASMLSAIDEAVSSIDLVTFVYWTGDIADDFATSLASKAASGLTVRVLLDAFGAKELEPRLIEKMQASGVELRWFRPLSTWRIWRSDKRTHRKILICDDETGFTGGVGIADEWTGNARNPNEWRDTHSRVRGAAILSLKGSFLDNWNEAGDWLFEPAPKQVYQARGDVAIQVVSASTTIDWTRISALMRTLIEMAEVRLYITTAYFVPEPLIVRLLCAAAERGVDARLLVPGTYTDSRLSQLAGQLSYAQLLSRGVKIWRYDKTLLHAKLVTVDKAVSCLGSANLNYRSLSKDEECSIVMLSKSIATTLDQHFNADCNAAQQLNITDWNNRSGLERLKERAANLFIEQL